MESNKNFQPKGVNIKDSFMRALGLARTMPVQKQLETKVTLNQAIPLAVESKKQVEPDYTLNK